MRSSFIAIGSVILLSATAALGQSTAGPKAQTGSSAGWNMPWQLVPASPASAATGEETLTRWIADYGFVRGTSFALASLGTPLQSKPGSNGTVEACANVVRDAAAPLGATRVEAASAGPQKSVRGGYLARVEMRVIYARFMGLEVRHSVLNCKVDGGGKILDAYA